MVLNDLLASDAYVPVNKKMAKALGVATSMYVGELIRQRKRFGNEEFFFTQSDMEEETGISSDTQGRCLSKIISLGFVTVKKKGVPSKNYYQINDAKVIEWMISQGPQNPVTGDRKIQGLVTAESGHPYSNNGNKNESKNEPLPENSRVKKKNVEEIPTKYDVKEIYSYLGGNTKFSGVTKLKGVAEKFCRIFMEVPIYQELTNQEILDVFETMLERFMENFKTVYVDRDQNLIGHDTVERELAKFSIYYMEHPDKKIKMLKARLNKWIITASQPSPYAK